MGKSSAMRSKIVNRERAAQLSASYKAAGKKVGYTSGVFDILHPGHVEYLEAAHALVDVLIVGLNSDHSVKSNKGELRPICSEQERAEVLAGLSVVDHVFIFSDRNNNVNVELLKPDAYIKAGDYSAEKLSSKAIVEKYGGRVELVPFKGGHSTTSIIERIQTAGLCESGQTIVYERRPAVFLDRDGTINEHIEYLSEPERFAEIPGAYAAIKRLRDLGFRIVIVTNQPGIGLGYFTKEDFYAVTREMMRQGSSQGAMFDKIYFCPHSKSEGCACRKPGVFFLERAAKELNIDLSLSYVIGDMTSDVQLGINGGCKAILVKTGRGGDDRMFDVTPHHIAENLLQAVEWIAQLSK
jgi:rfaE bifunctional protein nucleotidyltransferase chain/domain